MRIKLPYKRAAYSVGNPENYFQSFYYGSISFNINLFQIIKKLTAFSDQTQQRALRTEVFLVFFEVLGEVVDTVRK